MPLLLVHKPQGCGGTWKPTFRHEYSGVHVCRGSHDLQCSINECYPETIVKHLIYATINGQDNERQNIAPLLVGFNFLFCSSSSFPDRALVNLGCSLIIRKISLFRRLWFPLSSVLLICSHCPSNLSSPGSSCLFAKSCIVELLPQRRLTA